MFSLVSRSLAKISKMKTEPDQRFKFQIKVCDSLNPILTPHPDNMNSFALSKSPFRKADKTHPTQPPWFGTISAIKPVT